MSIEDSVGRKLTAETSETVEQLQARVKELEDTLNARGMSCSPDLDLVRLLKERDALRAELAAEKARVALLITQLAMAECNDERRDLKAELAAEKERTMKVAEAVREACARASGKGMARANIGTLDIAAIVAEVTR